MSVSPNTYRWLKVSFSYCALDLRKFSHLTEMFFFSLCGTQLSSGFVDVSTCQMQCFDHHLPEFILVTMNSSVHLFKGLYSRATGFLYAPVGNQSNYCICGKQRPTEKKNLRTSQNLKLYSAKQLLPYSFLTDKIRASQINKNASNNFVKMVSIA